MNKLMLGNIITNIRYKSRLQKFYQLFRILNPTESSSFLEVGVANQEYSSLDNFIIKKYPYRKQITALSLEDAPIFKKNYSEVNLVSYDGGAFPFAADSFDIVHANAVIEHVGNFEAQVLFLKEMVRVSKKGMITTPNKYFPIETHTKIPIVHFFGKQVFDRFAKFVGKGWATGDYMYLLSEHELHLLLNKAGLTSYRIIKNRFLGITMTFSVIWFDDDKKL